MSEHVWSRFFPQPERAKGPDYDFGVKALRFLDLLARYFRVEIHGMDLAGESRRGRDSDPRWRGGT
jgi:hypothetical protein